jgi:amino acid adenylation domain-containing protein
MTIDKMLLNAAANTERGITFINATGAAEKFSYSNVYAQSLRVLGSLQEKGLKAGDELVIQSEDNLQFITIFWACILGKIIPVPLALGAQSDQKQKVFQVWKYLNNPYLTCDPQHLKSLEPIAGDETEFNGIFNRYIDCHELMQSTHNGITAHIDASDIAYVQFSSGSTGDPKGVCLTHDNLDSNIHDIIRSLEITGDDVLLSWMPLSHDMGIIGFHLTGVCKAIDAVSMPTALFVRRPLLWMEQTSKQKASVLYSPNFALQYFLSALKKSDATSWDLSCVRILVNGAEPISPELCNEFTKALQPYGLHNNCIVTAYGLAEASVEVCCMKPGTEVSSYFFDRHQLNVGDTVIELDEFSPEAAHFVHVGHAISDCAIRICDDKDRELGANTVGHIQIRGRNVTAGYYNNESATAKVFTKDKWLRTGDLGLLINNRLVVTGRLKNIIIINGQNYYPHDIERVIINAGITETGKVAACSSQGRINGLEQVMIFILHKGERNTFNVIDQQVRDALLKGMGIYADHVVPVTKIPKTTSGKVRYFQLVEQFVQEQLESNASTKKELPAANAIETVVLSIASDLLGRTVDTATNLSDAGMNSLIAMKMAARVASVAGIDISAEDIFSYPDIASLCNHISQRTSKTAIPELIALPASKHYALTPPQRRIWTEWQLNKDSCAYNIPVVYNVRGPLNIEALGRAFKELVKRYEILRTSFILEADEPVQQVHEYNEQLVSINYIDARDFADDAERIVNESINSAFDLEKPCQFRVTVVRTTGQCCTLAWVIHHILTDGWSTQQFFYELCLYYNRILKYEKPQQEAEPSFQYRDYAAWHKQLPQNSIFEQHRNYWSIELNDLPDPVDLSVSAKHNTATHAVTECYVHHFPLTVAEQLNGLAKLHNTSVFTIVSALLNVLIYRYTGRRDIVTGFDTMGRVTQQLEQVPGYTLNTLPLRVQVEPSQSFTQVIQHVKQKILRALDNQLYPFENMIADKQADGAGNPLFSLLVLFQNFHDANQSASLDKCILEKQYRYVKHGFTDLLMEFEPRENGLQLAIQYNVERYRAQEIERLAQHLGNLGAVAVFDNHATVGSATFLTEHDQQLIMLHEDILDTQEPAVPVHILFEKCAAATPKAIAVRAINETLTYNELNHLANILAWHLKKDLVSQGDKVGFMVSRTSNIVIAMLAILKTGAAYVAIDPELPENRCQQMIADSNIRCVITDSELLAKAKAIAGTVTLLNMDGPAMSRGDHSNPPFEGSIDDLAYIIYTSGSTGKPKGVMIGHESLSDYVQYFINYFRIRQGDIVVQQASVAFDTIVEEIFPALCTSATIVVAPHGARDIQELITLIRNNHATVLSTTPLVLNEINKIADGRLASLRVIISGGDVLHPSNINRLVQHFEVYNTYGPSEATVCACYKPVRSAEEATLIGKPLDGRRIYILDENKQLMPPGRTGELYIEGGLAKGYLNLPELTAEKFIVNPFNHQKQLYRTGDMARLTESGDILFIGRSDHQLKVRGHRVEPGEVERVIQLFENVHAATVVPGSSGEYLVAFIVCETQIDISELRNLLGKWLPGYMIPYRFEIIEQIPVTATGKVDRVLLAERAATLKHEERQIAPLSSLERKILGLLQTILKTELALNDNLFEHGFNSITATRFTGLLHRELGYRLEIHDMFVYPTAELLAARIRQLFPASFNAISPAQPQEHYALSPAQQRLWILSRVDSQSHAYNEGDVYEMKGNVDVPRVQQTFAKLVQRHEILRTNFIQVNDVPKQFVHAADTFNTEVMYLDYSNETAPVQSARDILQKRYSEPFNLESGPLFRFTLVKTGEEHYFLGIVMHHIITDDWSGNILISEFITLYQSGQERLPALHLQYRDYADWINEQMQQPAMQQQRKFWIDNFSEEVRALELPLDFARPSRKKHEGDAVHATIPHEQFAKLQHFCRTENISLFMLLLSGVSVLFARYTGQYDMVIGSPAAGREHPDTEYMTGFFVNTLPLRVRFDKHDTVDELVQHVKQVCLDAYRNQSYPFDQLVNDLNIERDLSRSPLFDVMVGLGALDNRQNFYNCDGIRLQKMNKMRPGSKYDLSIFFEERNDGLAFMIEYDTHLFRQETISRMAEHYCNIMRAITESTLHITGRIGYLTERDKQFLHERNLTEVPFPEESILSLFERKAILYPSANCITCHNKTLNYYQVKDSVNALAAYFVHDLKIAQGEIVCLLMERSERIVITILALWKAGAAYLPIDPSFPAPRINYLIKDSGSRLLLTDSATLLETQDEYRVEVLPELSSLQAATGSRLVKEPQQNRLAYIIYTSGSTGEPKGVITYHDSVINALHHFKRKPGFNVNDVLLCVSTYTFDLTVSDYFLPLICGGHLVMATKEEVLHTSTLNRLLQQYKPNLLQATPSLLNALVEEGMQPCENLKIVSCGEPMPQELCRQLMMRVKELWNLYGPTETTILATGMQVTTPDYITVGAPHANTFIFITDEMQQPVAPGMYGDIYIGGKGVTKGYFNRPELTAQKFLHSIEGYNGPVYATGDIGRWLPDGMLEYRGRRDNQVKIRGIRIEPGEVETVINSYVGVQRAAVIVKQQEQGEKYLVAYVVQDDVPGTGINELRAWLKQQLPAYMIPADIISIKEMPYTASGKIDRKRLSNLLHEAVDEKEKPQPETEMEQQLANIWEQVLNKKNIGVHDSFFDLGGHSLKANQLVNRIQREIGVEVGLADVFMHPTIKQLSLFIKKADQDNYDYIEVL